MKNRTVLTAILLALLPVSTSLTIGGDQSVDTEFSSALSPVPEFNQLQPVPLTDDAAALLRGMIMLLIPETYTDDNDWGTTQRIQSGLNLRLDGARLRTSRRWKDINHGTWKRAEIQLLDPQEKFDLQVALLPTDDRNSTRYAVGASARLKVRGRQQDWINGVRLYSVTGDATADVLLRAVITIKRSIVSGETNNRILRILPHIESVSLYIVGFRLNRVGHAKGAIVREFGRSLKGTLNQALSRNRDKMASKINAKIAKKPERFGIPLGVFSLLTGDIESRAQ
jgi:hypothetical protein